MCIRDSQYKSSFSCSKIYGKDNTVPEGMRRSADSFHPEKVPRGITPRVEDLNNSEILRNMLSQAIEKSGNTIPKEIIYEIVSD